MNNNELEQISQQIVESQSFSFLNFEEAKTHFDFSINYGQYYVDYDRFTLFHYDSNLPYTMYHMLNSHIRTQFIKKLNRETKKCLYEYLALLWFCRCCELNYPIIRKTIRPDFTIINSNGDCIGIEVTELTSEIDKKRMRITINISQLTYDEALNYVSKYLGEDACKFNIVRLGDSLSLIPKEATCLTEQREYNSTKLLAKYDKYNKESTLIGQFKEFIILGDALRSPVAITEEYDADEVLDILKMREFRSNTSFVILFHDYKSSTVRSKGFSKIC